MSNPKKDSKHFRPSHQGTQPIAAGGNNGKKMQDKSSKHAQVIQNFVDALTKGSSLVTPAKEGLGSLQLANGMLLSQWDNQTVALPIDCQRYERLLSERIASSTLREPQDIEVEIDMEKSYR